MEQTAEIATALDIYADETLAPADDGRSLHVFSDNEKIKQVLEELFYNTVNVEFNGRSWARNLLKFGDLFLLNDVHPSKGVVNVYPIPVNEIEREEGYDRDDPMAVRYRWMSMGNRVLENWEVSHFRLLGNDTYLPYGTSIIEAARRIWRQLILIEDAMLVYRVVRAPERRVFYIDVGNIPAEDIPHYMELQKQQLKMNQVIDSTTGRVDMRYNALSTDEDFFIPTRGGDSGTRIDTLQAGQNTGTVEDVAYIQRKLIASLKIPKAYLNFDEGLASKACFEGHVQVPTFGRGGQKSWTFKELAEQCAQDPVEFQTKHHVYAWNHSTRRIVPARILKAWKTKEVTKLLNVTFDDGSSIRCTENHPFLLRNGAFYRRADELKPGDSIMPLRTRLSDGRFEYLDGYHRFLEPETNRWEFTHRIAGAHKYSGLKNKNVIHHVDFDKLNNDPSNLLFMKDGKVHQYLHASLNKIHKKYVGSGNPHYNRIAKFETLVEHASSCSTKGELIERSNVSEQVLHRLLKEQKLTWQEFVTKYMPLNKTSHRCKGYSHVSFDDIVDYVRELGRKANRTIVSEHFGVSSAVLQKRVRDVGYKGWEDFKHQIIFGLTKEAVLTSYARYRSVPEMAQRDYRDKCSILKLRSFILENWGSYGGLEEAVNDRQVHNHSVVSVEVIHLDEPVPVYDIEVEHHHNFAVLLHGGADTFDGYRLHENCVLVHNSLSQMDIRFSRTISIIQKTLVAEFNKLAIIHLYTLGFRNEDLTNFTLRLSNPSTVAEQQKLELWRTRFEIGGTMPEGLGSKTFVYKKIWGLTDDEIEQMNKQRVKETLFDATVAALGEGEAPGGGGGGGSGGGMGGGGMGGGGMSDLGLGGGDDEDVFGDEGDAGGEEPADDEGPPDEENAAEDPIEDEEPDLDLLTSGDDPGDGDAFSIPKLDGSAVKVSQRLKKYAYDRSRIRHHGSSKTGIPDFAGMLSGKRSEDTMNDPYDNSYLRSMTTNPLGESFVHEPVRSFIPDDVLSAIRKLDEKLTLARGQHERNEPLLISEGVTNEEFEFDVEGEEDQ